MDDVGSTIVKAKPKPTKPIQDYMHLPNFEALVNNGLPCALFPQGDVRNFVGFEPQTLKVMLSSVLQGNSVRNSCRLAGLPWKRYQMWMEMAERELEPYFSFSLEVEKAQALCEARLVDLAHEQARKGNPKLIQWLLEKRGDEWAPTVPETRQDASEGQITAIQHNTYNVFDRPLAEIPPEERYDHLQDIKKSIVSKDQLINDLFSS